MHIFGNLHPSFTFGFYCGEITETEIFSFIANLKIKFFILLQGNLQKITTQVVLFTVWFICLFGVGSYVCKFVCQFVGWRLCLLLGLSVCWLGGYVCYWVCLFVGLWTCHNIIFLPLRMVSVLDCFITELKLSMDFKLQMGRLLAILGVHLSIFFLCGLFLLCVLPWVISFMFGVVWVLGFFFAFFFSFVISIFTELLCFGRGI